jgi:hypothetical protein
MRRETRPPRPHRDFPDDIDLILDGYGERARVVQLWRAVDSNETAWVYLGRLDPLACEIEVVGARFGGGCYRAKILGGWVRERRQELYLEQVTFRLDEYAWPMTQETRQRLQAHARR